MSFTDSLKVAGAVFVIGLGVAFFKRGQEIARLEQINQAQFVQLKQQEQAYQTLQHHLDTERQATAKQKAINDEIQHSTKQKINDTRKIMQTQPCANTALDQRVLERLRQ